MKIALAFIFALALAPMGHAQITTIDKLWLENTPGRRNHPYVFVSIHGRFQSVGDHLIGDPVDAIECDKDKQECIDATAANRTVDIYRYTITRWDSREIVAELRARCQLNQLVIDLKDNTVTDLEIPINDAVCGILGGSKRETATNFMRSNEHTRVYPEEPTK